MTREPGRPPRARSTIIGEACAGTYAGTAVLAAALVEDSKGHPAWRPTRAAIVMALQAQAIDRGRVWMTPEEFALWRATHKASARKLKRELPEPACGFTNSMARRRETGEQVVTKVEALACAHYALGRDLPIPAGDCEAFDAWFTPRFGASHRVGNWLELSDSHISDRLRGFDVKASQRHARLPEAFLIRALDWLYQVGPVCPYGQRTSAQVFPEQETS